MATTGLQKFIPAAGEHPARDLAGQGRDLVEVMWLTGLFLLGGLLFLASLLGVVELLYFGLTMQNGMFVLPSPGLS